MIFSELFPKIPIKFTFAKVFFVLFFTFVKVKLQHPSAVFRRWWLFGPSWWVLYGFFVPSLKLLQHIDNQQKAQ